jgi:hypothetical protein
MVMAELLKVYPKDINLVIEVPLKELDALLEYMNRATILFDSEKDPEFKIKADIATALIKSLDQMYDSVKEHTNA